MKLLTSFLALVILPALWSLLIPLGTMVERASDQDYSQQILGLLCCLCPQLSGPHFLQDSLEDEFWGGASASISRAVKFTFSIRGLCFYWCQYTAIG